MTTTLSYKSPLHEMALSTPTCLWNDSASIQELTSSIQHGAVGATCNPVIILEVLKKEMHLWKECIEGLIREMPTATEDQIAWKLVEAVSAKAAQLLLPAFEQHRGLNGRLSVQTDPRLYRDSGAILEQAVHLSSIAPNIIVKIPATKAGIAAMEEATFLGVSVNATVCFSLPQSVAVAEAIERGLRRREQAGHSTAAMGPVCTIMVGRLDDWLKKFAEKHDVTVDPGILEWAGIAVFKKTYALFKERGYRARLLSAAFRNHMHWSELIGGNVVISPPYKWQLRFNASGVEVADRIGKPVDSGVVSQLLSKFDDFRRAYSEQGLTIDEMDTFAPTVRTLRQFVAACHDLDNLIRDFMLPNPD